MTSYENLIRTLLANRCLTQYQSNIFKKEKEEEEDDFGESLLSNIEDSELWRTIFMDRSINTLLQHYANIMTTTITHSLPILAIPTFQEYIDKMINIRTLGPSDYQRFVQSMKDQTFRRNMTEKYEKAIFQDQIKNHIIYIVRLYLLFHTKYSNYFTTDEMCYLAEEAINMIPYFEHISEKGWYLDALDNAVTDDQIELDACITIRNLFL
uniref:Uncharacterized protein n=1 Tax=viral metagenome TaxID=1070528 RepID=A0A6C0I5M6_9ZZZZ